MSSSSTFLSKSCFPHLIDALTHEGYKIVGPQVRDGTVMWDEIQDVIDLPRGWQDYQELGRYRLEPSDSQKFFNVVHGPESLKKFVFAPREPLLVIERKNESLDVQVEPPLQEKLAILGVRACDLAGLAIQDRVFMGDLFSDPYYQSRREGLFLVAVNCTRALSTCFCASMGTGPKAQIGFDLALTELEEGFVVEWGSRAGKNMLASLNLPIVSAESMTKAQDQIAACARSQTRHVDNQQLPQALYDAHNHPHWDEVASRCLACTNCTMVCPTCFCHTTEEVPDLEQQRSEHTRLWDSCFTENHGYIHGKNVRPTIKDRYRMWLTHKFASWIDQFGSSGCVGCGRCLTWCPVGIDPTEELHALLDRNKGKKTDS